MKSKKTNKFLGYISLLSISVLVFTACHGRLPDHSGGTVDAENRIALLKGGPHKGSWNTRDLAVNYNYNLNTNVIQLSGLVEFEDYLHYNFTLLDHFSLWIYFVGEEGNIVGDRVIAMADYRKRIENIPFNYNLELPKNAQGIAFGYDGRALEVGSPDQNNDGGGTSWDFWKVPRS